MRRPQRGGRGGSPHTNRRPSSRAPLKQSRPRPPAHERVLIALWKPYDVLSQFSEGASPEQRTLKSYVELPDVYAAGRLDRDSEGLLLLTNDGPTQHRLSDPRFAHERTYWAQVEGVPTEEALQALRAGVQVKGYTTRPAQARLLECEPELPAREPPIRYRAAIPTSWVELTLTEGKNRQVRRMTAAVGYPTLRLVRASICLADPQRGGHREGSGCCVTLEGLSPGTWREVGLDLTTFAR